MLKVLPLRTFEWPVFSAGFGGDWAPAYAGGRFSWSFARLAAEKSAGVSSEQRMRTAAEIFPSSSLEEIAAALDDSGLRL